MNIKKLFTVLYGIAILLPVQLFAETHFSESTLKVRWSVSPTTSSAENPCFKITYPDHNANGDYDAMKDIHFYISKDESTWVEILSMKRCCDDPTIITNSYGVFGNRSDAKISTSGYDGTVSIRVQTLYFYPSVKYIQEGYKYIRFSGWWDNDDDGEDRGNNKNPNCIWTSVAECAQLSLPTTTITRTGPNQITFSASTSSIYVSDRTAYLSVSTEPGYQDDYIINNVISNSSVTGDKTIESLDKEGCSLYWYWESKKTEIISQNFYNTTTRQIILFSSYYTPIQTNTFKPIPIPQTFTATTTENTKTPVLLSWDTFSSSQYENAGNWYIFRCSESDTILINSSLPFSTTTYTDNTAETEESYTYFVMFVPSSWTTKPTATTFNSDTYADYCISASVNTTRNTYIVSVSAGIGGSVSLGNRTSAIGESLDSSYYYGTVTSVSATATEGYSFLQWNDLKAQLHSITVTETTNLSATFTPNDYTITLNPACTDYTNRGSSSIIATYNADLPSILLPEREGYAFNGYWTSSSSHAVQYYDEHGQSVSPWNMTTLNELFAHWISLSFEITLDGQNATTMGDESLTAYYGNSMPTITIPQRIGYTFAGYFSEPNGGGTQYYTSTGTSANTWNIAETSTLYAHWIADTYSISFENESTTTQGTTTINVTYDYALPTITTPTKIGYTFKGYYSEPDGNGIQYYNADGSPAITISDITSNISLYSYWTIATYTITYNNMADAQILDDEYAVTYQYGETKTLPTNISKNGCEFAGWYTNQNFTGDIITEIQTSDYGNKIFYAKWTAITYSITYNMDGGSINNEDITTYTYGVGTKLPSDVTKKGFSFYGWYTDNTLTEGPISQIMVNEWGDKEYWAKWGSEAYKITLNTNYGTINSGNVVAYTVTDYIELPTNVTKLGYTFAGWYDNANFEGTPVTAIDKGSVNDKEFWAKWIVNSYTITLHTNEGTIGSGNVAIYTFGNSVNLPSDITRTGYTFEGWYNSEDCTGERILQISYNEYGEKEFWAKWKANVYSITYNNNGGTIKDNYEILYTYGQKEIVLPSKIERDGYTFGGWYENSNLAGVPTTTITTKDNGDKEFWAKWNVESYSVSFVLNGGTITHNMFDMYLYGIGYTLPTQVERTGYSFGGWYTNVECTGNAVTRISETETGSKTYYAQWIANEYAITFNMNEGSTTTELPSSYVYGETTIILPQNITKTGYTFRGWYSNSNYSGDIQTNISTADYGDKEYWARWDVNVYNLTLITNNGTINSGKIATYTYGNNTYLPQDVTRIGYTFLGWYSIAQNQANPAGSYEPITVISSSDSGDKELYAWWQANTYSITLHTNGGTIPQGGITEYTYGSTTTLPTNVELYGYTFKGWYENSYYEGSIITEIEKNDFGDKHYWARWTVDCDIQIQADIQPVSCFGKEDGQISISLDKVTEPVTIQWVGLESTSSLANNLPAGNYSVVITDYRECIATKTFTVSQPNEMLVSVETVTSPACGGEESAIILSSNGDYSYLWSDGSTDKDLIGAPVGYYSVVVTDPETQCTVSLGQEIGLAFKTPTISLVTVSQETGKNLVVWERESSDQIDYYTIYRQTAGNDTDAEFDSIGSVSYSEISVFEDTEANPMDNPYTYKISATDYCGNETELSEAHTTLHLSQMNSLLSDKAELIWTAYKGLEYNKYYIIRETDVQGYTFVDTVTTLPTNVTSYTADIPTIGETIFYIGIPLNKVINPKDFLKAESGPFSLAISNIAEAENRTSIGNYENTITAYAIEHMIYVTNTNGETIEVFDSIGKRITKTKETEIPVYAKGLYFVRIGNTTRTVIVK